MVKSMYDISSLFTSGLDEVHWPQRQNWNCNLLRPIEFFLGRPHMDSSLFSRGSRCRWVTQLWWLLLLSSIWIRSFLCFWEFEDLLLCLPLSWTIQGQGADLVIFFLFWIIEVVIRTGGFGPSLLIRLKQEIGKIISWVPFLRCQTKREF